MHTLSSDIDYHLRSPSNSALLFSPKNSFDNKRLFQKKLITTDCKIKDSAGG